jgi:hypothetical protein
MNDYTVLIRVDFEVRIRIEHDEDHAFLLLQRNERGEYTTTWVQAQWAGWLAAYEKYAKPEFMRGWNAAADAFGGCRIDLEPGE